MHVKNYIYILAIWCNFIEIKNGVNENYMLVYSHL